MSEERLHIGITADNSKAVAEFIAMKNLLKRFQADLKTATDPKQVQDLQISIQQLNTKIKAVDPSIAKLGKTVSGNTQTWLNFGRVIQDAPYGFQGIANNLTQLIPAVGAFGFAFSAAIAAIEFSQIGLRNWTRGSKQAKEAADEYVKVTREAAKAAGEETTQVRILYEASTNAGIAMNKRLVAAKELKEQYPQLFANYSAEEIALGKAKKAYDQLTVSIIENARAKAAATKIAELEGQKLEEEARLVKIANAANAERSRLQKEQSTKLFTVSGGATPQDKLIQGLKEIDEREKRAVADTKARITQLTSLQALYEKVGGSAKKIQEATIDEIINDKKDPKEKLSSVQTILKKLRLEVEGLQNQLNVEFITEDAFNSGRIKAVISAMSDLSKLGKPGVAEFNKLNEVLKQLQPQRFFGALQQGEIEISQRPEKKGMSDALPKDSEYTQRIMQAQQAITALSAATGYYDELIDEAAKKTQFFGNIFNDLSNALLQGQSLGDALGNTFRKLVADIAAAAAKAAIFASILSILPGGGVSLGKIGGFGGIFKKMLGFSEGGTATGPKSGYPVLLHGTESIFRPDQLGSLVTKSMQMGAMQNGSFSGDLSLQTKVTGQDLLLWIERSRYSRNLQR